MAAPTSPVSIKPVDKHQEMAQNGRLESRSVSIQPPASGPLSPTSPPRISPEVLDQLRRRSPSSQTLPTAEEKDTRTRSATTPASSQSKEVTWNQIYALPHFQNEESFKRVFRHVNNSSVQDGNVDLIYTQIKAVNILLAEPSFTLAKAVRRCFNDDTLKRVVAGKRTLKKVLMDIPT